MAAAETKTPLRSPAGKYHGYASLILFLLVFAGFLAISDISGGPAAPWLHGAKSPYGYMRSMALFLVPIGALLIWLELNRRQFAHYHKAFWKTCAITSILAAALDVFLGNTIFLWPNPASYVGRYIPGFHFDGGWTWNIPIEELVFYLAGNVFMLLGYVWASAFWVPAYSRPESEYEETARGVPRLALFQPVPLIVGVAVFLVALAYKKFGHHPDRAGFPLYFMFLDLLVVVPSATLYRTVGRFINVRAFLFVTMLILLLSLMWEGTLGLAYGWWNYQHERMIGIFIQPWYGLPIEEIVTWTAAAWMNINILETLILYDKSGRRAANLLLGTGRRERRGGEAR